MARRALLAGVRTGQGEFRLAVIEGRTRPRSGCVAQRAILREARGGMIRVSRAVILCEVA